MRRTARVVAACLGLTLSPIVIPQDSTGALRLSDAETGLRLAVDDSSDLAALRIRLPSMADTDPGIFVLFPEHVTVLEHGRTESRQLYRFQQVRRVTRLPWRRIGQALEYDIEIAADVHMVARATLEPDGVRYRYEFTNRGPTDYDWIQAVSDPRLLSPYLHDLRLARTYVHHKGGFDLFAAETPTRLDMPLNEWLPSRYRASYSWPIDRERTVRLPDGTTWYNKSRPVDEPFLATTSVDGRWIVATFSDDAGNVWTNPEFSCQHADPQAPLPAGQTRRHEVKTLVVQATLDEVLASVRRQRATLAR